MAARAVKPVAIVNQDHGTALDSDGWSIPPVPVHPAGNLALLSGDDLVQLLLRDVQHFDERSVHNPDAAFPYRSEAELSLPGAAELAHNEHVERGVKGGRNLRGHGDTAPREAQHQWILRGEPQKRPC
jgi:hypothetical protein